ncbi:MAG: RidA family protein [Roseiarcus sp.]
MRRILVLSAAFLSLLAVLPSRAAEYMDQGERLKGRTYSPAVVTEGGRTIWLAGESTIADLDGKDISGNMEAQTRTIFALIDKTLKRAGGSLKDVVTMTVYMTDVRNGATFQKIRAEMFPDKNYPASAQLTISNLVVPGSLIEIQAVAMIGDKCSKVSPCLPH